jgi:hypothetical protein
VVWDGRDRKGTRTAAGTYLLRMTAEMGKTGEVKRFEERVTLVR